VSELELSSTPVGVIRYLPVMVTWTGMADPTNGPYVKASVPISTAPGGTHTFSISEALLLTAEQVAEGRLS